MLNWLTVPVTAWQVNDGVLGQIQQKSNNCQPGNALVACHRHARQSEDRITGNNTRFSGNNRCHYRGTDTCQRYGRLCYGLC